jgi:uncharacterized protein with NAD-binding domain and iron-sulfur cluster
VQIAVIGAGPAGLATAFHLTEAQRRGELDPDAVVTVYEASWRPGGKGASGRNPELGHRIEEHGIHLFGAFYLNAFAMLRTCYRELCGDEAAARHLGVEFLGNSVAMARGTEDGEPRRWFEPLPSTDGAPWDADAAIDWDLSLIAEKLVAFTRDVLARSKVLDDDPRVPRRDEVPAPADGWLGGLLEATKEALGRADDRFRPALQGAEMFAAVVRGVVADDLRHRGIDAIDGESHLDWLRRHGLSEDTLTSSMVEAIPAVCFQFPQGDSVAPASMSAAGFVAVAVRQLLAPGEFNYFFRRGTGETVILPLVLALHRRGVRFRYRHRLVDAELDAGGGALATLHLDAVRPGTDHDEALIEVPHTDVPTDHACGLGIGQAWSSTPPADEPTERIVLRAGDHFDAVVLALPPATFADSCPALAKLAGLDAALPSVATVAAQLWFEPDSACLLPDAELHGTERLAGSDWEDPCNGWTDYSDLIAEERWSSPRPGALVYFCGTVRDDAGPPDAVARRELEALVSRVGCLFWGGEPTSVVGDLYAGGRPSASDEERVDAQYVRVNAVADQRYVLAGPGTLGHRPRAWESGYRNLVLAGDWTRQGFNVSSFEGSVMSGALAAYAVCGSPDPTTLHGYRLLRGDLDQDAPSDLPPPGWRPIV